jgi:hypothetical protein
LGHPGIEGLLRANKSVERSFGWQTEIATAAKNLQFILWTANSPKMIDFFTAAVFCNG